MDGAKHNTETLEFIQMDKLVSRRGFCVEFSSRGGMERKPTRILAIVGSDFPENGKRRKGKVSLAIFVSQGLVSP